MVKPATLEQIGQALGGISKQAVHKYVKRHLLIQNKEGWIDIEEKNNWKFLKSKEADLSVFYPKKGTSKPPKPKKIKKKTQKPVAAPAKTVPAAAPAKTVPAAAAPVFAEDKETELNDAPTVLEIDTAKKIEEWRGKKKDNALKDLKLNEEKTRLLDKTIVQKIIFDVLGHISRFILSDIYSLVDEIISIVQSDPDTAREKIVSIFKAKLAKAMKKAVDDAKKVFRKRKFEE